MWLSCAGYVRLQTSLGELNLELHCDMVNTSLSSPSLMFLALTSHTTHPHTPHQSHSTPVTLYTVPVHAALRCYHGYCLCRFLWPARISSATVRMVTMTTQSSTAPFVISWYTVVNDRPSPQRRLDRGCGQPGCLPHCLTVFFPQIQGGDPTGSGRGEGVCVATPSLLCCSHCVR